MTALVGRGQADEAAGVPAGPVNTLDEAFAFAGRLGLPALAGLATWHGPFGAFS